MEKITKKLEKEIKECEKDVQNIREEIGKVVVGQEDIINSCIKALSRLSMAAFTRREIICMDSPITIIMHFSHHVDALLEGNLLESVWGRNDAAVSSFMNSLSAMSSR